MRFVRTLVWAFLVLAAAAYGSVVVRNINEVLAGITTRQPLIMITERQSR